MASATIPGERLVVASLPVRPAPPAPALPIAATIAADVAPPARESLAQPGVGASTAQQAPRAALPAASSAKNTKKKAAARRFRRGLSRSLPAESRR